MPGEEGLDKPFRLPADEAAHICAYLLEHRWDWTVDGLDEALAGLGWAVRNREPDRSFLQLASLKHSLLGGLAMLRERDGAVISIVLDVTSSVEETDGYGQAQLDAAAEILAVTLPSALGFPDHYEGGWPVWSGAVCDIKVRREELGVSVVAVGRGHVASISGEADEQQPLSAGRRPLSSSESAEAAWQALGAGLGKLLGSLARFDWVSFKVDDVAVLAAGRGEDLWVLATGPQDTEEPVDLSYKQQAALAELGFHPPLGERAEHGPQRESWWIRHQLPVDRLVLESTGHLMVSAVRNVYGAGQPAAIVWFSMSPIKEARWVLDSLGMTKSEFQED